MSHDKGRGSIIHAAAELLTTEGSAGERIKTASHKNDDEVRQKIIDSAAELFATEGYGGTRVKAVAKKAGVSAKTVRRLSGGRADLFAAVIADKVTSKAAEMVEAAATEPSATPPLAVLLEAAQEIFAAPERSWNVLELEALLSAHRDDEVLALASARIQKRWANMKAVVTQTRAAGGIDETLDDDAFVHYALALSVGMAMVSPVVQRRPTQAAWNALMARIGTAVGPSDLMFAADRAAHTPWRVRIDIPDRPGGVARLVRALSSLNVYVVAMGVVGGGDAHRTIDLALTAPESVTGETVLAAAMSVGRNGYVTTGSPEDGTDLPTRLLDFAADLVADPEIAPEAASALVEADGFEVTDATEGPDDRAGILRLQWTPDEHVVLHREWAPFARAEQTRASALLRLSAGIAALKGVEDALGWVDRIKDGWVWTRLGRPEDADAVAAMHDRCSERSRYQRYFSAVEWRDIELRRLSGGHRGATLVVMNDSGTIIGLGNVFPDDPGNEGTVAEVAMIIEDAYQGRGVGGHLLRHLVQFARRLEFTELVASVLAENDGMLALFEKTGLEWSKKIEGGVYSMRAPLPARRFNPMV